MIALLVMTDGRGDCLARSVASFDRLHGPITQRVIHDDSGSRGYARHLAENYPGWEIVSTGRRAGFAGAYRSAWRWLRSHCTTNWVFSTEDDFVVTQDVNLSEMAAVMQFRPHMAQMALLRQAWNEQETAAGGIVQMHPGDYHDASDGTHHWLQHRRFFTTNPHLLRTEFVRDHVWPEGSQSEGRFGVQLFNTEPATVCGFWGRRDDPPRVEHIGTVRIGTGY